MRGNNMLKYIPYVLDAVNSITLILGKQNKKDPGNQEIDKLQKSLDQLYSGTLDIQKWMEDRERERKQLNRRMLLIGVFSVLQTILLLYLVFTLV